MRNKKKILLCCNSDIGRKNTIGFRFAKITQILQRKNIPFEIVARKNFEKSIKVKTPFYKNYLTRFLNGVRIYFLPNFDSRSLDLRIFDNFVLRNLKKSKIDYSLAHFGEYSPNSISYLKSKGVKILLDIPIAHYQYAFYLKEKGFKQDTKIGKTPSFLDRAISEADVLIVPSLFVKESLEMARFKKPIEIVPFGAEMPKNFDERDIEKKLEQEKIKFIFAGNVNYRKGVNFLLEAWDKLNLKNSQLFICGRLYKTIRKTLKNYRLNNVFFTGFVDLEKYFSQAHVFVFPTLLEGSAKVIYEAMSYGLPVITTPNAGSIVEDEKSGFIVPIGQTEILAEKMQYFYQNPKKIVEMGKNAFFKVKNFSWDRYGERLLEIYQKNMV